jgi:phosphatidylglycerophosphatase A
MARRFLPTMGKFPDWLVNGVSTLGGLGYLGPAPGTSGAFAGTLFYGFFGRWMGFGWTLVLIVGLFIVGWAFSGESEHRMGKIDPGCVIFDEFAAMPIVFLGMSHPVDGWRLALFLLAGFGLFRFFDILKPLGISRIQKLPGGLGIMLDDTAAAIASCLLLHAGALVIGFVAPVL